MKKYFFIIFVISALGCDKEVKIPDNIIPKEKMVSILIDIHMLEERIDYIKLKTDSSRILYRAYEYEIFKEHNVDTTSYYESYDFYSWEVRHMLEIYEAVVDSLNVMQKQASSPGKPSDELKPGEVRMSTRQKAFEEERNKKAQLEKLKEINKAEKDGNE